MTQVGKGAFSTVYRTGADTVAKKYNIGQMLLGRHQDGYGIVTDESCWESFMREVGVYSKLRCSDTEGMFCRYRSHDSATSTIYIELGQQIEKSQWDTMAEPIVIHLAQTLAALHGIGIVHGDIKADNIVHVRDRYTFIDFGCSIQLTESTSLQQNAEYFFKVDIRATKEMLSMAITKWNKDCGLSVLFDTVYSLYFGMHNKVTRLP